MMHLLLSLLAQANEAPVAPAGLAQYTGPGASLLAALALAKSFGLLEWAKRRGNGGRTTAVLEELKSGVQASLEAHAEQAAALKPMAELIKDVHKEMGELRIAVAELKGALK